MNIYDIAEKANVSIATVSRVLNNSCAVSDRTREKVLSVIERENYYPNIFARGLTQNSIHTIGILYTDASDLFLASAVYYLEKYFRRWGYNSLLSCCGYELEQRKAGIELMLLQKVDSIVLAGSHFVEQDDADNAYIREAAQQLPIGILSGCVKGSNIVCAYCDDKATMLQLSSELFERGSQKVIFAYNQKSDSNRRKISGLEKAYNLRGREFRPEYAVYLEQTEMEAMEDCFDAIYEELQFDTVVCMDDMIAVSVLKYAEKKKLRVPEQLRVVGYNNSVLARCTTPSLSTVDNCTDELSEKLVKMVVDRIENVKGQSQYVLWGKPVFRETT